ncbi:hypothetical protein, partial [Salinicola salarius]|uniref:hypothetical protein n=1 Tax=Salinicola salarius TaxID=430457 RepID=UPI0026ECA7FB
MITKSGSIKARNCSASSALLTFGLVAVRLIREGLGREDEATKPGWGLLALGALSATLLNPTFAQKIVLTSYADT